jgi:hypothetical protein
MSPSPINPSIQIATLSSDGQNGLSTAPAGRLRAWLLRRRCTRRDMLLMTEFDIAVGPTAGSSAPAQQCEDVQVGTGRCRHSLPDMVLNSFGACSSRSRHTAVSRFAGAACGTAASRAAGPGASSRPWEASWVTSRLCLSHC